MRVNRLSWLAMAPLAFGYAGILAARSVWWKRYARTPPLPTVSIGNLTIGGNAKTPFALFLAGRLHRRGVRVAIVSRGYGGQLSRGPRLVSNGSHITMTPRQAGDEPVMMAKSFEGPIAVARRRIDAIKLLASHGLADAVVLDDGFQHVRLRRDCDLLLMNQSVGFGNGWLLPAGPLRENRGALQRADALVLIQSSGAHSSMDSMDSAMRPLLSGKLVLRARVEPSSLTYCEKGSWHQAPLMLKGRRVAAVSGIANPAGFHAMVGSLGANLIGTIVYPDHYEYGPSDWKEIVAGAGQAEMVITTEKDLVKLADLATPEFPLYALRLNVAMEAQDESQLLTLVLERIRRDRRL